MFVGYFYKYTPCYLSGFVVQGHMYQNINII